jgi:hypothetical protein
MKHTRRKILGFLSALPISSVAFASDLQKAVGKNSLPEALGFDFENEMLRRLDEGTLSTKYYDFMGRHKVTSVKALASKPFSRHKDRMTKEFVSDLVNPASSGGVVSTNALSAIIPPDEL